MLSFLQCRSSVFRAKYTTMSDITSARKLFDLLVSRDFDPEMLDSSGKPAADPA